MAVAPEQPDTVAVTLDDQAIAGWNSNMPAILTVNGRDYRKWELARSLRCQWSGTARWGGW